MSVWQVFGWVVTVLALLFAVGWGFLVQERLRRLQAMIGRLQRAELDRRAREERAQHAGATADLTRQEH